ncbi:MAG: hypothetical protein HY420_03890 [Candidatus Kerfeldbacteria bacterium]|nr:hypothetical protein [Candidatus Kerfeldbacteria bacterium]
MSETPPTGSPADLGQWPRLLVTQANRAKIRSYVHTYYSTQFQNFLNHLGSPPGPSDPEIIVEGVWGPVNYAFPVALGVQALKDLGYTFPAPYDTDAELCTQAYSYWANDITDGTGACTPGSPCRSGKWQLQNRAGLHVQRSDSVTTFTHRATGGAYYVPSSLLFDWCHAQLSAGQRQDIANAFYEAYQKMWEGDDLKSTTDMGTPLATTSSGYPGMVDDQLFALTVWGDTDVLDSTKRQTLYDTFHALYPNRYFWELANKWPEGWSSFYGTDYWSYTVGTMAPPVVAAINTALGTAGDPAPYASNYKQFTEIGKGTAAWLFPETIGPLRTCGVAGNVPCHQLSVPWGDNTAGLGFISYRSALMTTGFLRFMGMTTGLSAFNTDANVARWVFDKHVVYPGYCDDPVSCSAITGSHWANDVFYYFLFGSLGTTPTTPTAQNVELGWNYYLFRDDYTTSDTQVFFGAQPWLTGGHDSLEFGSFTLRKFGALVVKGANWRSGTCRINGFGTANNLRNNVGLHIGSSDNDLGEDTNAPGDADFAARGLGGVIGTAALTPKSSFGTRYSYVFYDADPVWTAATKMQREFVYLRGETDHEYLVILDRANVNNTENDPVWKMWVTNKPECVDAACSNPRAGKWTTTGKVLSVTNQHASRAPVAGFWNIPAANAKMFHKALLPTDAKVQMLGDDGSHTLMFQLPNDDGSTYPFAQSTCEDGHYELYGWGQIQVRPGMVGTTNTFLNVIQFGSATTLTGMAATDTMESDDGNFVVARISDTERNRLVVFAKDTSASPSDTGFRYTYTPTTAGSDHLVVNLAASTTYYVAVSESAPITISISKAANGGTTKQTDASGVLAFQVDTVTPDTVPPTISNGQPTGTLPAGTTSTTISVTTNEAATCRYSTTPNVA